MIKRIEKVQHRCRWRDRAMGCSHLQSSGRALIARHGSICISSGVTTAGLRGSDHDRVTTAGLRGSDHDREHAIGA
jgi:hypothetical protein